MRKKINMQDCRSTGQRPETELASQSMMLSRIRDGEIETKEFHLKRLFPGDIREILNLQNETAAGLENPSLFVPSPVEDYLESMLIDFCCGLYADGMLAAVCMIVFNRETERNLFFGYQTKINDMLHNHYSVNDFITFDTIQVRNEFRGFGIQRRFLEKATEIALSLNAEGILATVSPQNGKSRRNFEKAGFRTLFTTEIEEYPYMGVERCIYFKLLK